MDFHTVRPGCALPDSEVPIGERVHPVEQMEKSRFEQTQKHRYAQMQELYGFGLPMRHKFMENLLSGQRRAGPLESSYIHLDNFRGDHTSIAWEDYLNDPQNDERTRKQTHLMMEEQLFGRVLQPIHTKDII